MTGIEMKGVPGRNFLQEIAALQASNNALHTEAELKVDVIVSLQTENERLNKLIETILKVDVIVSLQTENERLNKLLETIKQAIMYRSDGVAHKVWGIFQEAAKVEEK